LANNWHIAAKEQEKVYNKQNNRDCERIVTETNKRPPGVKTALKLLLTLAILMSASSSFSLGLPAECSQAELAKLANKEFVIHSKDIPGCPWPEITIFGIIDAAPVEAAALFSNYQEQKNYIPDLIKSHPVKKISENETIVDFEMRTPWPLANSKYSTGNVFSKSDKNEYEIRWYLVESDSLIDSKGTVQFTPYGKKTLLRYRSFIYPDSKLASIFSSKAKSGIAKTVQAIVAYIEETKRQCPEKIQGLINSLPR